MENRKKIRRLCSNCEKKAEFEVLSKEEVITVKRDQLRVQVPYLKCKECGDEVLDPSTAGDPFNLAYNQYRAEHGLLKPEEIRAWRKAVDLSQSELSKLTGIGTATLSRYENGSLQEESHDKLLRLAMKSENLAELVRKSEGIFSQERKARLLQSLQESLAGTCSIDNAILLNFGDYSPDKFSGFRKLDLHKLYNMILFFSREGVLKTKLNKLLFYADFKHFKEYALPVTGARYAHVPFGPAPDKWEMYLGSLQVSGAIELLEEPYPNGYIGEIVKAKQQPDLKLFSNSELRIMAGVAERFSKLNASQITEYSHKEAGYLATKNGELISYEFAEQLE
ncbi:MAG: type II TA system antitoxin MqsA family protein [Chloroflexota bacterium]